MLILRQMLYGGLWKQMQNAMSRNKLTIYRNLAPKNFTLENINKFL